MAGMRARSEGPGILPDDVRGPVEAERIGEERGKGAGDLRRREDERQLARLPLREMVPIGADFLVARQQFERQRGIVKQEERRHGERGRSVQVDRLRRYVVRLVQVALNDSRRVAVHEAEHAVPPRDAEEEERVGMGGGRYPESPARGAVAIGGVGERVEDQIGLGELREENRIDADPVDAQQLPVSYDFRSDAVDLEGSRHPDSIGGRESALIEVRGCRAGDDCALRDRRDVPAVVYGRDGGIAAYPHEYDVRYRL